MFTAAVVPVDDPAAPWALRFQVRTGDGLQATFTVAGPDGYARQAWYDLVDRACSVNMAETDSSLSYLELRGDVYTIRAHQLTPTKDRALIARIPRDVFSPALRTALADAEELGFAPVRPVPGAGRLLLGSAAPPLPPPGAAPNDDDALLRPPPNDDDALLRPPPNDDDALLPPPTRSAGVGKTLAATRFMVAPPLTAERPMYTTISMAENGRRGGWGIGILVRIPGGCQLECWVQAGMYTMQEWVDTADRKPNSETPLECRGDSYCMRAEAATTSGIAFDFRAPQAPIAPRLRETVTLAKKMGFFGHPKRARR